ncbi:hypothetical protein IIA16_03915 [bacterium]|nr:hypothetical protein [bacterium]
MQTTDATNPEMARHLKTVGVLALLWNGMGAFDFVMTQTRFEAYMRQFSQEQLAFYYGIEAWAVATWAVAVWGGVLGAALLLARRRFAAPVLLVSWFAMVATSIENYLFSNGLEVVGDPFSLAFAGAIFLVALALAIYARAMVRQGVLRA